MDIKRFEELMGGDSDYTKFKEVNRVTVGLNIIAKYLPQFGIEAAEHDVIYSVDVDKLATTEITQEEVTQLREMGWWISEEFNCLGHYI